MGLLLHHPHTHTSYFLTFLPSYLFINPALCRRLKPPAKYRSPPWGSCFLTLTPTPFTVLPSHCGYNPARCRRLKPPAKYRSPPWGSCFLTLTPTPLTVLPSHCGYNPARCRRLKPPAKYRSPPWGSYCPCPERSRRITVLLSYGLTVLQPYVRSPTTTWCLEVLPAL
jgi:hypothetical protein